MQSNVALATISLGFTFHDHLKFTYEAAVCCPTESELSDLRDSEM